MLLRIVISTVTILLLLSAMCATLAFSNRNTERSIERAEQYIEKANTRSEHDL